MTDRKTVGLIGLGLIGTALARRLLAAGFAVVGYDVDAKRGAVLGELGGRVASTIAELANVPALSGIVASPLNPNVVSGLPSGVNPNIRRFEPDSAIAIRRPLVCSSTSRGTSDSLAMSTVTVPFSPNRSSSVASGE